MAEPLQLTYEQRIELVKLLDQNNKLERIAFFILSVGATLTLIGLAVFWVVTDRLDFMSFLSLFAPAGVIGLTQAQVLKLWYESRDIVLGVGPASKAGK